MPFTGYRITSPFGWRTHPVRGNRAFHTGIDLVKPHKAPIYAFTAGEVTHAKLGAAGSGFGGYGNVVAIRDIKGHLHVYAHLDACAVWVGANVKKGQVIGYQGNTGISTGSHLHYEVRKKCTPSHGWEADRENNCFEPTKYLKDFNKAPSSLPSRVFKVGDKGKDVMDIQSALASVYFYPEKSARNNGVDGSYGPKTENAVKRFQSVHGLVQDGKFGPQTKKALEKVLDK